MQEFRPFANDAASITISQLTIENGTDRIALYGSLDLTCDKQGLAHATALKTLLDQAIAFLSSQEDLPDSLASAQAPKSVKNPFA